MQWIDHKQLIIIKRFNNVLVVPGKVAIMSRTVAFGMDALGSGEDLEELLAALTGDEVTVEM